MFEKFIIRSIAVEADAVIIGNEKKEYRIRKKDLREVNLSTGDQVCVFIHPNYPDVVAGLKLGPYTIFHKMKEDVVDEYMAELEARLIDGLSELAKHRLKMFEMANEDFALNRRFAEATALSLGRDLFFVCGDLEGITDFPNLSYDEQRQMLPKLENHVLPTVPAEKIAEIAAAYLADSECKASMENSVIMYMPLADADRYGDLCQPRDEYIKKYVESL